MSFLENASLIITSIAAPNKAMQAFSEGCTEKGIDFIVIGDTKSPVNFQLNGCRFYSIDEQKNLPFRLAKNLPERHYSRKNIGYLLSKNKNAIIETDDDNFPKSEFWEKRDWDIVRFIDEKGWVNVYSYFTKESIWPRGLPIEKIRNERLKGKAKSGFDCTIVQGLADGNPDVDAIYRMTGKLPVNFEKERPLVLGIGCWSPFNSQNTIWRKEAFPLLYLPSYCSFRMTDIWRSFIAQRIAWTCNWNILFESATVVQDRNEHDLLKDFEDEIPGYLHNATICRMLEDLDLKPGKENILENLRRSYYGMIRNGCIKDDEMKLLELWCEEFV